MVIRESATNTNVQQLTVDVDLCSKYYRASRYRVLCAVIVLVELSALVAQTNDLHFWKTAYIYKDLTELHMRVGCASTELRMHGTKIWIPKNLNMYLSNNSQGRLSN